MRKRLLATSLALVATVALATPAADIDYSDFDDTLMRDMDDAIKELDANLGGQDAQASLANTKVLSEGLDWAEKYFAAKPEAPRGAGLAREGREHLTLVVQSIEGRDFDAASTNVRGVVRSCKACHEAYKPAD
jgi:cytochrome c556